VSTANVWTINAKAIDASDVADKRSLPHRPLQPCHEIRVVDALVSAYGDYVGANAPGLDRSLFQDVLFNAIDGNALYEIEQASQELRDDGAERAYYAHHNVQAE
jgi:hypothetical protein